MRLLFVAALSSLAPAAAVAANIQCMIGSTRCIQSQGTEIPSKKAIEVIDQCSEFTANDIGRVAMKLSDKEIIDRWSGRITPLLRAWHAYSGLIESPLAFERKPKAEDTKYFEIKRACETLDRDFNDPSKWAK